MAGTDSYKTIRTFSSGSYKEKGSRFIAEAYPVRDESDIRTIIDSVRKKHHSARHHCFAYFLGKDRQLWRVNDDGEPSGTAGRPILSLIKSLELTNILIIVSRYFGGTLLGISGLINAYRSAAAEALNNAEIIEQIILESYEITYPYSAMNEVMKILKSGSVEQSEQSFDMECSLKISLRPSAKERILKRLLLINGLKYRILSS
ncbi:MAG: YigZ family protein [Bacteroidales bacterium]|nr:YigZ family protein [Bacteroidales bacterium]